MEIRMDWNRGLSKRVIIMTKTLIPQELIADKTLLIRGKKVMLDRDLAKLYSVETRTLNQAVKRNIGRFPADFMFQLNKKEFNIWTSQSVMSKSDRMGLRRSP